MASPDVEQRRFSDVMYGHKPLKDPRGQRRASRRTSEGSGSSPKEQTPALDPRRKPRSIKDRRSERALRRASDTALLPPIRVSTICHPASPVCDVTGDASSPTSNASCPIGSFGNSGGNAGSGGGVSQYLSMPLTAAEREVKSPINRKETQSNMSAAETADTNRLSPIAGSDKLRAKAERRVLKSVSDVINDIANSGNKSSNRQEGSTPTPKPKMKSKNRSVSLQTLPKISPSEEPFSIRRKIEQFRKWHEEQYTEKLKKLKVESEKERVEKHLQSETPVNSVNVDFDKLFEENMQNIQKSAKTDRHSNRGASREKQGTEDTEVRRRPSRCKSGATWKTWRDVNDSYAYNDVTQYIEENELLPPERASWIRDWLSDVEKALNHDDEQTVQEEEVTSFDDTA